MTDPVDFLIDGPDGQRSIMITAINVTLAKGVFYSTGQYNLREGKVGLGNITFNIDHEWDFDGISDLSDSNLREIVSFIRKTDNIPLPTTQRDEPEIISGGGTISSPAAATQKLAFITRVNGRPVDVWVEMNYPVYDVMLAGEPVAQLEQDHHSNWYVSKGHLDDELVQEIGRRVTAHIAS